MARAVTEPHPLWETVHAPKIKFQEALDLEKLFGKVPMSFALHPLGWWVPFSRVKTVPKTKQVSGNHDNLSTPEQVTAPLWTSVSSRRMGIETALKGPSFHALIFQDSIRSCRLNSQGPGAFSSLLLKVFLAQISPWVSAGACLPVLWNSEALQVMIVYLPS